MHRGHRRMYRLTGLPGWMRYGHHGTGCGHGPWHHGTIPLERGYEPYRAGLWGASPTAEEEREFLKDQAEALRRYLGRIERRIAELEPSEA
jgi:hypothetical protein